MGILQRLLALTSAGEKRTGGAFIERRSTPTSWDLLRGHGIGTQAGVPVGPHLAENLSAVFACVQIIAETIATLPLVVYRREGDGKVVAADHPVARLFTRGPNGLQTPVEFIETMQAHCLLRGNAYALIERDNRGAPITLIPLNPDCVSLLRIPGTQRRIVYEYSDPHTGRTDRYLAEEILHLKDRSDDGVIGKSRLARARETFGIALSTELHAASVFRNSATLSGVLSHPDQIGQVGADRLRAQFDAMHKGPQNAGEVAILEEGMTWTAVGVSPEATELLASRQFSIETIARIFRVPPPVLGDLSHGTYSNVTELGRWFYQHTLMPWLTKWERTVERSLFSEESRRTHEVEFDADVLVRGDMLQRFQAYRIGREVGLYSANELRKFESLNPRTDADADAFLSPMNMSREQTGQPKDAAA